MIYYYQIHSKTIKTLFLNYLLEFVFEKFGHINTILHIVTFQIINFSNYNITEQLDFVLNLDSILLNFSWNTIVS